MCGFTGFFLKLTSGQINFNPHQKLERMSSQIAHRGPDAEGYWGDVSNGLFLAHRRLAILDLSENGRQPMISPSGRFVLVFNGEIYNHLVLRKQIGYKGAGTSDTETVLACLDRLGLAKTLEIIEGMFSLVLWDKKNQVLSMARDRFGEKPLYYGLTKIGLVFGSEMRCIETSPLFDGKINQDAIYHLLKSSYVPSPLSIYEGINKLPAGCYLNITKSQITSNELKAPQKYWDLSDICEAGMRHPYRGTLSNAVEEFDKLAGTAIERQMISDVPLGCFLSGGLDSSYVAMKMTELSGKKVRSFTIGFDERAFNEAPFAKRTAAILGLEHNELYIDQRDALNVVPNLQNIYDEPFADSSQIPTYLVSKFARQSVKVALTGDGADELLGGYNRYVWGEKIEKYSHRLSAISSKLIELSARSSLLNHLEGLHSHFFPGRGIGDLRARLRKLSLLLSAKDFDAMYRGLISQWDDPNIVLNNQLILDDGLSDLKNKLPNITNLRHMMLLDATGYLPHDILTKVDRASMAVSLETRAPFLDRDLNKFCWSLPKDFLVKNGKGKWLIRENLKRRLPNQLIDRPKSGFGVPIGSWLRRELRDWAEELLNQKEIEQEGILDAKMVSKCWEDHIEGKIDNHYKLWPLLMFQQWKQARRLN